MKSEVLTIEEHELPLVVRRFVNNTAKQNAKCIYLAAIIAVLERRPTVLSDVLGPDLHARFLKCVGRVLSGEVPSAVRQAVERCGLAEEAFR